MRIIAHYRNDYGTNATLYEDNNEFVVVTDLSAKEKHYNTEKEAKHDLAISGFEQI